MNASVLILDDSLTVRMDLVDAFAAAGFRTLPCATLSEARELVRRGGVDAAILDLMLPDGDGVELLSELRGASSPRVPVLILSTEAEVRDRVRSLQTGADEYVGKPYDVEYLIARVRELLRIAPTRAEVRPILVIEDSLTFREELTKILEQAGYPVVSASSGEEGLRLANRAQPRAVITDGVLPGMDGTAVIRRIKLDAALRTVPCVLLTGSSKFDDELRALDAGADAFLHKNADAELVLAKLAALLRSVEETVTRADARNLVAPKKILTVDDSATYREELASALRDEGYQVIAAQSGEEAIELLSVEMVDCVLLDLLMPGMGGEEVCRRLKAVPHMRDTPIIVLTSVHDRDAMLGTLAQGADDYMEKSAELDVLKARLRTQLRRRQFEEETRRVREQLLRSELDVLEARAARELAETRAALVEELERANHELKTAYHELKAAQTQLVQSAKMASLGQLVAGVAHEINNPLAFVISHNGTVRDSLDKLAAGLGEKLEPNLGRQLTRAQDRLNESQLGLGRIRELVVKLRTFSRLDEGEHKAVSIRDCIESVLTILGHRMRTIEVVSHFGEPDQVECYPSLLNQAIMNLVANAIDAMDGHGRLTITSGQDADAASYRITVTDTGVGIPEDLRERVLEPFFTTKPVGQGTGLGLSITYSITQRHGGTLSLEPASGGGTRAAISFPIRKS